jgi:hypothetical protein
LEGPVWLVHAAVARVIDGDTVVMDLDLGWHTWRKNESVRLAGIDTPERGKPGAGEATAFTARLLPVGTEVLLVSEKLDTTVFKETLYWLIPVELENRKEKKADLTNRHQLAWPFMLKASS